MSARKRGIGGIFKRGATFYGRITINGRTIVQSLHTSSEREARARFAEWSEPLTLKSRGQALERIRERLQSNEAEQAALEAVAANLAEAWRMFEGSPRRKPCDERSLDMYRYQWGRFSEWMTRRGGESVMLADVTKHDAYDFMTELKKTQSTGTYNKYLSLLRRVWRLVGPECGTTANPWLDIATLSKEVHRRRPLTVEELADVMRTADAAGPDVGLFFALGAYTGLRRGDCIRLEWGNVDMVRRVIVVTPHKTRKAGTVVTIPIHAELYRRLAEIPARRRRGRVCSEIPTNDTAVTELIGRIFDQSGIARTSQLKGRERAAVDVGFHSLRHTFVSLAGNAGVPLAIVQSIVGHTDREMTAHYFHASLEATAQAVNAIPALGVQPQGEVIDAEEVSPDAADAWDAFTKAADRLAPADIARARAYLKDRLPASS